MQFSRDFFKRRQQVFVSIVAIVVLFAVAVFLYFQQQGGGLVSYDSSCVTKEERVIRGESMNLTLKDGEKVQGLKGYFDCNPVAKNQVVVLEFLTRPEESFVKRVVALGKDTLEFKDGKGFVNREVLKNPAGQEYQFSAGSIGLLKIPLVENKIQDGYYMVMSDEVGPSAFDSRQYGFVEIEHLKGLVVPK
ncbi:MAG: signal peptidase I [Candidatus Wildermuthbacteria bacterium]|nr:signal peptidase I [Candidatus Wildermuthbacteria bacterium]